MQAREWWQQLRNGFGTAWSAFVAAKVGCTECETELL
jgi:hypothetical protein